MATVGVEGLMASGASAAIQVSDTYRDAVRPTSWTMSWMIVTAERVKFRVLAAYSLCSIDGSIVDLGGPGLLSTPPN